VGLDLVLPDNLWSSRPLESEARDHSLGKVRAAAMNAIADRYNNHTMLIPEGRSTPLPL
jgi:hypothetical protein